MEGGLSMRINIHDTTPASKTPKYIVWMFVGLFVLTYSIFAMLSFCVIFYANEILGGILIAFIPFVFLFWFLWDQRNLSKSFVEIYNDYVIVTEYPWGRKTVTKILIAEINHTKLLTPNSINYKALEFIMLTYRILFSITSKINNFSNYWHILKQNNFKK